MQRFVNQPIFAVTITAALLVLLHTTLAFANTNGQSTPVVPLTPTPTLAADEKPGLSSGTLVTTPVIVTTQVDTPAKPTDATLAAAPVLTVWYGGQQPFGQQGNPQRWANILGNVANPTSISSLVYTLNGGAPRPLSLGPDKRRLAQAGDFNIELDITELQAGANQVVVTATDKNNVSTVQNVTVNYTAGTTWPLPYTADWGSASTIQAVAQIVDGQWAKTGDTIRPTWLDYDRLIGIGDMSWTDYEVVVPITIHAIDAADGFKSPSNGPGIGMIMRWSGHYQETTEQPRIGWRELGALGWFRWSRDANSNISAGLQLLGYFNKELAANPAIVPEFGKAYLFKMRVESVANAGDIYRFKVWEAAQAEPAAWHMEGRGVAAEPTRGSLLLVAHHVDASFGKVTVTPLTNNPVEAPYSDDFNACALDSGRWSVVNPRGDATIGVNGQQLTIAVPGGVDHNVWSGGNFAPRIMQVTPNQDFEVITKFESLLSARFQMQGVLVEQDANHYLRFDFSHDGTNTRVYAASFVAGEPTQRATRVIAGGQPLFMRISRTGNQWTQAYSTDGTNWLTNVTFAHALTVTKSGVFAGNTANSGGTPPAHTALIDYFYNSAAPIVPEDGYKIGPTVQQSGNGTITLTPNQTTYSCGQTVTLTATPANGWTFAGWSGALNSVQNPATVAAARNQIVIATFTPDTPPVTYQLTTTVQGNGALQRSAVGPYAAGKVITLTVLPAEGWTFVGWAGDLAGNANPAQLTMSANRHVTAILSQNAYGLTTQTVGDGVITRTPAGDSYPHGTQVELRVVPAEGWQFVGWSGALTGTENPVKITMNAAQQVTATLVPRSYGLTIQTVGNGEVRRTPAADTYPHGATIQLNAIPAEGWQFVGWSGALGTAAEVDLVITSPQSITATFTELIQGQYTLSTVNIGEGQIQLDPQLSTYPAGTVVTARAIPASGWTFVRWEGDLTGVDNPQQLVIQQNQLVGSVFTREMVDFATEVQGLGTIESSVPAGSYAYGTAITVTAVPAPGLTFLGWAGDLSGNQPRATILLDRDINVIARFGQSGLALATQPDGQGEIVVDQPGPYTRGQAVTLHAIAADGWSFTKWRGDLTGTENPTTVVMDGAKIIVAVFEEIVVGSNKVYLPLITR